MRDQELHTLLAQIWSMPYGRTSVRPAGNRVDLRRGPRPQEKYDSTLDKARTDFFPGRDRKTSQVADSRERIHFRSCLRATFTAFFSVAVDASNRSSVGAVDIDIVAQKIVKPILTRSSNMGRPASFYADGVSIGGCYTASGLQVHAVHGLADASSGALPWRHWTTDSWRRFILNPRQQQSIFGIRSDGSDQPLLPVGIAGVRRRLFDVVWLD